MPAPIALLQAQRLAFAHPGQAAPLFAELSFVLAPGLSLIRGGDGRGKSSLLRLIAGELSPDTGRMQRQDGILCCFERPADPAHDDCVARAWLAQRQQRFASSWQPEQAEALIADFGLRPHLDKPLYMLSTGSRRKLGLVAAAASGAALTLIDTPFAALDAGSCRVLARLLSAAAASPSRAWVIADYELPASLADVPLAARVELGD